MLRIIWQNNNVKLKSGVSENLKMTYELQATSQPEIWHWRSVTALMCRKSSPGRKLWGVLGPEFTPCQNRTCYSGHYIGRNVGSVSRNFSLCLSWPPPLSFAFGKAKWKKGAGSAPRGLPTPNSEGEWVNAVWQVNHWWHAFPLFTSLNICPPFHSVYWELIKSTNLIRACLKRQSGASERKR